MTKSVTLIELIIAISLIAVIVLSAVSFDVISRKMTVASERKAIVVNELSLILDMMQKDVLRSSGISLSYVSSAVRETSFGVAGVIVGGIRHDLSAPSVTMRIDPNSTPSDFSDDIERRYIFWDKLADSRCVSTQCCALNNAAYVQESLGAIKLLSQRVVNANGLNADNRCMYADSITFRYDPSRSADNSTNPEVSVKNIAFCSTGVAAN